MIIRQVANSKRNMAPSVKPICCHPLSVGKLHAIRDDEDSNGSTLHRKMQNTGASLALTDRAENLLT